MAYTLLKSDGSLSSRINLIGCPLTWLYQVHSCEILSCPYSDHSAVVLNCARPEPDPNGPGRWKLNTSILSNAVFVDSAKTLRQRRTLETNNTFHSFLSWWDWGKERIKGLANNFCKTKAKDQNVSRAILVALANHLKWTIDHRVVSFLTNYQNVPSKIVGFDLLGQGLLQNQVG